MLQHSAPLIGRDDEVGEVVEVLRSSGTAARSLLITGGAGCGKTAVLEQARRVAVVEGAKVLRLGWEGAEGTAGSAALADAVCGVLAKIHDGRLPARVTAVRRVQLRTTGRGSQVPLLSTLGEVLADAAHYVPFALVLDDVQRMPAQTASALGLLLRAFRPAGVPVVMASRPMGPGPADGTQLPAAVDRMLELPPLPPVDIGALIAQRLGRPVEPSLATAVLRSLGPLAGRPAAVLSVLACLEESGGLLEINGEVCLAEPEGELRLTADTMELGIGGPEALSDADVLGTAALLARMVAGAELSLDDLHRLKPQGGQLETVVRTLDHLVKGRVLTVDDGGRIAFAVPAFAAALRSLHAPDDVRSLHARIVTSVTDRLGAAAAGAGQPRLAEHAVAAGSMLDDALTVPLLRAAVRRRQADWPWAARGYRTALRRLRWDDSRMPDLLRESAGVSLRYADHSAVLELGEPLLACLNVPHGEKRGGLGWVTRAWALSALHEHRTQHEGADPRYRTALERAPDAAELLALGGLYGIGPTVMKPPRSRPAADHVPAPGDESGSELVPTPVEVRLIAAAVGSNAEFERARRGLPRDALGEVALDRLRNAAGFGDLAGALEAVLGERYVGAGNSTAVQYHAMVRDYLAGNCDSALSAARQVEARGRSGSTAGVGQLARALAAEIHLQRGEFARALKWLELIPRSVTHPLVARVRLKSRCFSGDREQAVAEAWRDLREARERGLLAGVEWLTLGIMWDGMAEDSPEAMRQALEELEALHEQMASSTTHEAVLLGRGLVYRDVDSVLSAYRLVQQRGDAFLTAHCCQFLAEVSDDPQPWLAEATRILYSLGARRPIGLRRVARQRNLSLPRNRAVSEELSEHDVRLIELVSEGSTNRQIAAGLVCSEKTVEQRLTRLFQRTGCRSRAELTAAWLDGSLAGLGLVPDTGSHRVSRDRPAVVR
ncbi:DNA-binding CsgD family transcriptional regulator [Streptomyces sp. LBL]|uniref:helix-turn-helix transcriptional regulator n=1 Tax=Streptomyces sp. LBL TaxID=2940562 RepID=UPI002474BA8C|nr:LuxR family transcriptional regulator [Streptomyces sp. LBL]MDH6630469.1 DNA-binding CsgD family transcriptional regulator [Streptomyces sp. LBL]